MRRFKWQHELNKERLILLHCSLCHRSAVIDGIHDNASYVPSTRILLGSPIFEPWKFSKKHQVCRIQSGPLSHHWREPTFDEEEKGKNGAADFFERVKILYDAGALEWAYYLKEDDQDDANRIYPIAVSRHGKMIWEELESIVGGYATRAASALSSDADDPVEYAERWEASGPNWFTVPADRLARQATVVGIPRLRHRARTLNASRWRIDLVEDAPSMIETFRGIVSEKAPELLETADKRFADFNGSSTVTSTPIQRDINDSYKPPTHEPPSFQEGGANQDDNWFEPWSAMGGSN